MRSHHSFKTISPTHTYTDAWANFHINTYNYPIIHTGTRTIHISPRSNAKILVQSEWMISFKAKKQIRRNFYDFPRIRHGLRARCDISGKKIRLQFNYITTIKKQTNWNCIFHIERRIFAHHPTINEHTCLSRCSQQFEKKNSACFSTRTNIILFLNQL